MSDRLEPLVTSLSDLTTKLSDISDQAKGQLEATKGMVFKVKNRVETILEFEDFKKVIIENRNEIIEQLQALKEQMMDPTTGQYKK